jgi:hypothetical protein
MLFEAARLTAEDSGDLAAETRQRHRHELAARVANGSGARE